MAVSEVVAELYGVDQLDFNFFVCCYDSEAVVVDWFTTSASWTVLWV